MQDTGMPNIQNNQTQAVPRMDKWKSAKRAECREAESETRAAPRCLVLRVFLERESA
jgi:hypothetical protein